ncbi:H-type small acid-soluble spore protein [Ornithinibacillus halophilus]|uniref:Small, acid-soluble spore protein H n=1 Tax=Ornithinibacillus halophilus TaxID=930117 RepID=A0A1M5KEA0_9BACI|nr:H-type small acid-soluble spore protein [Ornithinibacillus halophilus]SHG50503.1 small acid-soluble spore protein H (minor) [Ornithinibacillus halophilus]
MDKQRAEEIINAPNMINVKYHGFPVYIQQVNQEKATVFPLDEMHHQQEVDLNGLYEEGP